VLNALTIDVEEYFQVAGFAGNVSRDDWARFPSRVETATRGLLDILAEHGVRATFFFLGWIAERHPGLVREVASRGHEIASHGYDHQLIYDMTPRDFDEDVRRAKQLIEDASGMRVRGYRAPSFSITPRSLWAFEIISGAGHEFSSSVYPVYHDRYGMPGWPRGLHDIKGCGLVEAPPTTVSFGPLVLPCAGGGYFRLYPYRLTRAALRRVNGQEGRAGVVYLHPWELDPDQPRLRGPYVSRLRHYLGLRRTAPRLRRLLSDFRFAPLGEVIAEWRASGAKVSS